MNDFSIFIILNLSYIIGLIAWVIRDILWVRTVTVVSYIVYIIFLMYESITNYSDIMWASLFSIVNITWIVILIFPLQQADFPLRFGLVNFYGVFFKFQF